MIAFSMLSTFTVRLPAGDKQNSMLHMIIYIRDVLDCVREVNMSSLIVSVDAETMNNFISSFQTPTDEMNRNPIVQLLSSGNQNVVGQVLSAVSQEFNRMNSESIDTAVSSNPLSPIEIDVKSSFSRWNTCCNYHCIIIGKFNYATGK